MSRLSFDQRLRVTAALVDGCSIRTTERQCAVHRDTIMRWGLKRGTTKGIFEPAVRAEADFLRGRAAARRCLRAAGVSVAVAAAAADRLGLPAAARAEGALGRGAISDTRRL